MKQFQDQSLADGAEIGVYQIKGVLNANRFGATYHAWNHHLNMSVVLREYFPRDFAVRHDDGCTVGPKSENERQTYTIGLEAFLKQAEMLADSQHTSVVRVHNTLQFNDSAYMVMEYEEANPLSNLCDAESSFTEAEIKSMFLSLIGALSEIHARGFVHGDIHPGNILIRKNGDPFLINFAAESIAIACREGILPELLRVGYAPIEQYKQSSTPDMATDIYALGATMYRCITHTEPLPAVDRVSALERSEPDPMRPLMDSLEPSDGWLNMIDRMCSSDSNDRLRSVSEVEATLDFPSENSEQTSGVDEQDSTDYQKSSWFFGTRRIWVTGGIGIIAALVVGVWYFQPSQKIPTTLQAVPETQTTPAFVESGARSQIKHQLEEKSKAILPAEPESRDESHATVVAIKSDQAAVKSEPDLVETQKIPAHVVATTDQDALKIHMAAARKNLAALNLTTPANDNAYLNYQAVLALDPGNAEAREGVRIILDRYVWMIENALKEGRLKLARIYLYRAGTVSKDAPELQKLTKELSAARFQVPKKR